MKKLICMLLALVLVLSLCACGGEEKAGSTGASKTSAKLRVGYGKADITPQTPVPMGGYGRSAARISQGFLSYLYVTCVAISDADDNTILVVDNIRKHNKTLWKHIVQDDQRATVTFDLSTGRGIVSFDSKRVKQNYLL